MTPQQCQRVNDLFAALRYRSVSEQRRTLDKECVEDTVVRTEVERLLQAHEGETRTPISAEPVPIQDLVGKRVGPYQILRILGRGGMGIVYLAHDTRLSRDVALKAVLPGEAQDALLSERLRREARVLALLSHPNVAIVYGLEEAFGAQFLAMEYVDGTTLGQRVSRGGLSISEALRCGEQIAAGLEAAHIHGIIHRDLKPANIMLTAEGNCKVLDFGLARAPRDFTALAHSDAATITQEGSLVGTPAYMSPEQIRGEPLDSRSDVFSFGAVLFRCFAGRRAFEGESLDEIIDAILLREPDWSRLPQNLPSSVIALVKRCLAKDMTERYRDIGDVKLSLRDARATSLCEREGQSNPHAFRQKLLVAVAVTIAAVTTGFAFWQLAHAGTRANVTAQRFDVAFPGDVSQADLERVQLALSPDGQSLVVACKTLEGQALWVRSHSDGRWARLEQTEGGHRPMFSADGQWISFFRAGHLYKHRPTGRGDPIQLDASTNWYGACWADDGTLVYAPAWCVPLQRLDPGAATPRVLSRLDLNQHERAHICPAPVPRSRWILYNAWNGGDLTDIHAINLDSGQDHLVVANASTPHVSSTIRGDFMLFERSSIIFAVPFDCANAKTKGAETAIAEGVMNDGTRFAAYFDVASDGTLAYVPGASFAEESRLAFVNSDGTTTPFNEDRMSFCEPVFATAADKLAVIVKGKIYRCLIYDMKRQTREFLVSGGDTLSLAVSADGKTLACTVNREDGYGIDLMSLDDTRRSTRIVPPPSLYPSDLVWTPDSKFLCFSMPAKEGSPSDIWLVEPRAEAKPRALVSTSGADIKPMSSPNGEWMAYQSDVSGRPEVYLVSCPDGLTTRQVSNNGGRQPAWSPDGQKIYFIAPEGLVSVSVTSGGVMTGKPSVVYSKHFGQSDPIAREYAIAPDGRPLIVEPSERRPTVSHINVITNWYGLLPQ